MFWPGVFTLWAALLCGLASVYGYFRVDRGAAAFLPFARRMYALFVAAVLATSAILLTLILQHRFDIAYVASYSSRDLPLHFLISTFWAGQQGSFLLWIFWGSLIGLFVWRSAKEQEAPVMIVYLATFLALVAILCKESPFTMLKTVPADGKGLNPLLQDYWMVIHPPVMFAGFASLSVPFSFAIAALWKKKWDGWIRRAVPWAMFTFLTLGTAILMGGYWAYKTLGWGGYWGWDPVENTSLVPWLFDVALVHGMILQRSRGNHKRINLLLAVLAYVCILYGTFLTRSGILADFSVHSFVDLGITGWLVAVLLGFLVLGVGLLIYRWKEIPSEQEQTAALSRSVLLILGIAAIVGLALVILLGTSAPLITRLGHAPSQVSTRFYHLTASPGAMLLVLLFGLIPFVAWKGTGGKELFRNSRRSLVVAAAAVAVLWIAGGRNIESSIFIALCAFAFDMNLQAVIRKAKPGKFGGAGGYLAHAGVAIMLVGVVVSAIYAVSRRVTLPREQMVKVFGYQMTFTQVVPPIDGSRQAMEVNVVTPAGRQFWAYPKMYVNPRTNQLMVNPAIRKTPLMDLYISPQEYDPGAPRKVGDFLALHRGQSATIAGTTFRFDDFQVDPSQMTNAAPKVLIGAKMTVTPPGGAPVPETLQYVAHFDGAPNEGVAAAVPGASTASMTVESVSAAQGAIELHVLGLTRDVTPARAESLSLEVTRKPLIALVWGGFYIMMFGAFLAFLKRISQARQAPVTAKENAAGPAPNPLAPSPAHARVQN